MKNCKRFFEITGILFVKLIEKEIFVAFLLLTKEYCLFS